MKKFFAIAIIAASFAACNNSGEKKDTPDTTVTTPIDTAAPKMDTAAPKMDTAAPKMDTAAAPK